MSETSVTDPNSKTASQAEPRRARVRIAMTYTEAYVSHFKASAMEAEGSTDSGKLRGAGWPNGTRHRNQTSAVAGDMVFTQAAGRLIACKAENSPNAASTAAGTGTRRRVISSAIAPASASADTASSTGMCTVPMASTEPTTTSPSTPSQIDPKRSVLLRRF